jgi:hypothetical protein
MFWGGAFGSCQFLHFVNNKKKHFGQIFGCLQNVGSSNNAATANSATPKHI